MKLNSITLLLALVVTSLCRSTSAFVTTTLPKRRHNSRMKLQAANTDGVEKDSSSLSPSVDKSESSFPKLVAKPNRQVKDIVVIGGGLAGLSSAMYVSQLAPHRHVTILDREEPESKAKTTVASMAAAGMLAPQSERLPKGPLLDLCLASRKLYPDFCDLVETLASQDEVSEYLYNGNDKDTSLKPWSVGYVASGGFLAPAFAGDAVATWAPPEDAGSATWLDAMQVRELEPNLHPKVVGGWWFPEDASVDSRRLTCSLRAACIAAGVQISSGKHYEVSSLDLQEGACRGLWLTSGKYISAKSVLVANGAWMRTLLPVPIEPHKGQSLSLRMPPNQPPLLRRVLFAQDSYIVPKADGRIVVGATVEAGSYDANVTPAGLMHILGYALQLVPGLADLPLEETWVGLRPTTPDKGPILGDTPWSNLYLAGGYWRNGVLLAPKTGQLLACLLADLELSPKDRALLDAFSWDRFTGSESGTKLAANARYAASMHPIHQRTSGVGVAASVGTELGVYSDATTAAKERQQEREALWGIGSDGDETEEDAFERAARMGVEDAAAFVFEDDDEDDSEMNMLLQQEETEEEVPMLKREPERLNPSTTTPYEGSPDAITVPGVSVEKSDSSAKSSEAIEDISPMYEQIQENMASREDIDMSEESSEEDKPDPGFRIYHVDPETREERMVPPYTSPQEFKKMIAEEKQEKDIDEMATDATEDMHEETVSNPPPVEQASKEGTKGRNPNLDDIYKRIKENKDEQTVEMNEPTQEERPDPGFRIYRVDPETRQSYMVPPYTTPGEMTKIMEELRRKGQPGDGKTLANTTSALSVEEKAVSVDAPQQSKQQQSLDKVSPNGEQREPQPRDKYNEQTFDGYTAIQNANARSSREEELEAMREARRKNRLSASEIDISDIGAQHDEE